MTDLQKERELFEWAYHKTHAPIIRRPYPILKNGDYQYIEIDKAWKLWQAAKELPEGYVLAPKEPTQKMLDSAKNAEFFYGDRAPTAFYKTMIDAIGEANE